MKKPYHPVGIANIFLAVLLALACSPTKKVQTIAVPSGDTTKLLPLVSRLAQLEGVKEGLLKGNGDRRFYVQDIEGIEMDEEEELPQPRGIIMSRDSATVAPRTTARATSNCNNVFFTGSDRKDAKLVYSKKAASAPESLQHLVDRLLASEPAMLDHDPELTEASDCVRVEEEMENVVLEHIFIYVIIHEGDGDYHLIVGDGQHFEPENLMNLEISGLPDEASPFYNKLKKVREKLETYKSGRYKVCGAKSFVKPGVVLPEISIKGSLFYDIRHAKRDQHSGSGALKTKTFWEVHPVTYLKFWN